MDSSAALIEEANCRLRALGYAAEEAHISPAEGGGFQCTLEGSLVDAATMTVGAMLHLIRSLPAPESLRAWRSDPELSQRTDGPN